LQSDSDTERHSSISWSKHDQSHSASQTGSSSPSVASDIGDDGIAANGSWDSSDLIHDSEKANVSDEFSEQQVAELMEQEFIIKLKETETFWLYDHLDESVPSDAPFIDQVRQRNKKYEDVSSFYLLAILILFINLYRLAVNGKEKEEPRKLH